MNKFEVVANAVFIFFSGCLGAYLSKWMKVSGQTWAYFISGVFTVLSWIWVVKRSPYNLVVSSIYWDVLYNAAWIGFTIIVLKESSSINQSIGAAVVVAGLLIMGM